MEIEIKHLSPEELKLRKKKDHSFKIEREKEDYSIDRLMIGIGLAIAAALHYFLSLALAFDFHKIITTLYVIIVPIPIFLKCAKTIMTSVLQGGKYDTAAIIICALTMPGIAYSALIGCGIVYMSFGLEDLQALYYAVLYKY